MKKRLFSVLLFLLITVALVACSLTPSVGDAGNQTDDNQIVDPESNPLAFLEAAGEKLKNADSFEMQSYEWEMRKDLYSPDQEKQILQMQYVKNLQGTPASRMELEFGVFHRWWYFHGNVGYQGDYEMSDFHYFAKHVRNEDFRSDQHFWFFSDSLDALDKELFDRFCQLSYEVSTEESGNTVFLSEQLSLEQLRKVMNVNYPLCLGNDDLIRYSRTMQIANIDVMPVEKPESRYRLVITVDQDGYLSEIQLNREWLTKDSIYLFCGMRSINFTEFNKETTIEAASYEDNFTCEKDHPTVLHHFGDHHTARYTYNSDDNTYGIIGFNHTYESGFLTALAETVITTCYPVPTEIEGIPVTIVYTYDGTAIDCLVIPKGVSVGTNGETGIAGGAINTLYFEDTKDNVYAYAKANLHKNYHLKPTCYFAGEWEYADGVPTPIGQ